jgi:hypothetical protein
VPAALALSPASLPALELGAALAIAGAGEAFARRALGLGRGRAQDHERAAAGVLLLAARLAATRVLLAEPVDRGAFEEHTARLFGAPLPAALHGAWPLPQRGDGARLLAALGALPLARELRERCDEDWFRNPRAGHLVASLFAGPVWPPAARAGEDLAAAARGLGAEVEGRLG